MKNLRKLTLVSILLVTAGVYFSLRTMRAGPALDSYKGHVSLGSLSYLAGKKDEAIQEFKKAIKINSNRAGAYYNLALAYYDTGRREGAINAYKKALKIKPDYSEAFNGLGDAYYGLGKKLEAIEEYKKAVKVNRKYADAYYNLGKAYVSLGMTKDAISAYEKVIEINTDDADVCYNLAILHYHERNYQRAAEFCDKAISLGYEVNPEFLESLKIVRPDDFADIRRNMVETQLKDRNIADRRVLEAMRKVKRHLFVPDNVRGVAYEDAPLSIGHEQTIPPPYIVAYMAEAAALTGEARVLEIGTGSGYQAAVLAEIVKEVYTIEIIKPLADSARERLEKMGYKNVKVKHGDGYEGWQEAAPFDAILVTAVLPEIPKVLVDQLKVGGKMVIPAGSPEQELYLITRTMSSFKREIRQPF